MDAEKVKSTVVLDSVVVGEAFKFILKLNVGGFECHSQFREKKISKRFYHEAKKQSKKPKTLPWS